jgi:uncharacterized protein (DUF2236 family)
MHRDKTLPLFDPDGVFWRVNREAVLLVGGGSALLLQIAHPLVAAGVAEHSGFREQPVRRLYRTVSSMQKIIYADRQTALDAASRVNRVHATVHGVLTEPTPVFPVGTPYRANDPALLLWVHATLVETALRTYETFLPALHPSDRERYYQESKTIGALLGLTPSEVPEDYAAFSHYFRTMVEGPELHVTPTVAELAEQIIHPPISWFPRIAGDALSIATTALVPEPIRELYGLRWSPRRKLAWDFVRRSIRRTLPYVPEVLHSSRRARRSEKLFRRAVG